MRLHLIEFHEQSWVPGILRRGVTDYLRTANEVAGYDDLVLPLLHDMLEQEAQPRVLDLGSGAGGSWGQLLPRLNESLGRPVNLTFSDMNPRVDMWRALQPTAAGEVSWMSDPVDARATPTEVQGLRTLFNLFHHFQPADARAILADAAERQQPILIVETLEKSWLQGIMITLLAPLLALVLTLRIRPLKAWRFLFTYLIPILPLLIMWDGLVSVIRLHDQKDIAQWCSEIKGMTWKHGVIREKNIQVQYIQGIPN